MADIDSDDEELKRAIAFSLAENPTADNTNRTTLKLQEADASAEDEQIKRAIALSLQDGGTGNSALIADSNTEGSLLKASGIDNVKPATTNPAPASQTSTTTQGILGLDRKAMEAERLARLASLKRKAGSDADSDDISPPPTKRSLQASALASTSSAATAPTHASTPASNRPASRRASSPQPSSSTSNATTTPPFTPQYPRGVVKQTWVLHQPRTGTDIKLEEVLQPRHLKLAVLSAFQWDIPWLLAKLECSRTRVVFVMQCKDAADREKWRADAERNLPNVRVCFPPMPGNVHCMHSKLMLLGYENVLRVVVPTANLMPYDWGETGVMENSVFLIDLPRRKDGGRNSEVDMGLFGRELVHFCRAKTLDENVVDSLYEFDFSGAEGLAFVHSIGGEQMGNGEDAAWHRTGAPGLGRAVRELGLSTKDDIEVDFVASSIGSLNDEFLSSLYLACQGDDGTTEYNWRTNAANIIRHVEDKERGLVKARTKAPDADLSGQKKVVDTTRANFRLFFPSRKTVEESRGGTQSAGTVCFQKKWWEGPKFPRQVMKDCKSRRQGVLMHNKIIFVRRKAAIQAPSASSTANPQSHAWAYVGSANCSESAWGKLTFNKTAKQTKLTCRNWECGVLIPAARFTIASQNPSNQDDRAAAGASTATRMSSRDDLNGVFVGVLPVPMEWPASDMLGKEPWFFEGFR